MEFNLADLFECVVDAAPDDEALVAGETRLTFRQLDERANQLAHHLQAQGVSAGDHVAIHAYNRGEWMEATLGIYKIRAVPININFRYVADELRYVYDNADIVATIVERGFLPRLAAIAGDLPALRHVVVLPDGSDADAGDLETVGYEDALAAASPERGFPPRSGDDHYILYTGGTTGMPKGVVWRHEDIFFAAFQVSAEPLERPEDIVRNAEQDGMTYMVTAPLMHGAAQWTIFNAFFGKGPGRVVLYCDRHFDPDAVWRIVERERCNTISVVGDAMARPLIEALETGDYDTSSLFVIGSGGAILSPSVKRDIARLLPDTFVIDAFGSSESGATGTGAGGDEDAPAPRFHASDRVTVLDDDLRPVQPGSGVVGRLARSGRIPLGYYKDDAKTAETFIEVDGARWVIPGDAATIEADGTITVFGRGSVCIQTGGEKVFPEEVESVLKAHPQVWDAVVVGVPDDRWVERVAAVVQPRDPATPPDTADLDGHCRERLAGYKVPREWVLVEEIERTPAAKPDYRWAKAQVLDRSQIAT